MQAYVDHADVQATMTVAAHSLIKSPA